MYESVLDFWARLVDDSPDAAALLRPSGSVATRRDIDARSDDLRSQWESEGLKARGVLALNLSNGVEWMSSFIACMKLRAVAVSLDPGFGESELVDIAIDLGAQAVWDGESLRQGVVRRPYVFRNKDISIGKLTSGSTGKPKALFFTEAEMIADARNLIGSMGIRPSDTNLGLIPWGHSYGLGNIVYPLMIQGTRAAWTDTPFPVEIGAVCRKAKCTIFPGVPTLLGALNRSDCSKSDFNSLRLVISAGARLDSSLAREFLERFGKRVHSFYGSTETGGVCFDETGDAALTGRSVGKPIEGVSIIPGRGKRFYVDSPAVYGYGNRKTSAKNGPMALMADYGGLDANGELVLESRVKNLMKIGARRISPVDIERRLRTIGEVTDVAVFSVERKGDAVIAAAIESAADRDALKGKMKEAVPIRLRPKKWIVYDRFPQTVRGKLDLASIKRDFV